jgi:hypothetical protein
MIDVTGRLIDEAQRIAANVDSTAVALEQAMRAEADAKGTMLAAKQAYSDAESEARYDAMINADGRNAEARAAQVDRALIAARNGGELAGAWRQMTGAQRSHDAARLNLETATMRHKATCTVADLQAAMLRAVAR